MPSKVLCNDSANTVLCWKELECGSDLFDQINTAAQVCSAKFNNGDISKANEYPGAVFSGTCTETEDANDGDLPCVCAYEVTPPLWGDENEYACVQNAEDPTTGDPTTGGSVDTDGPIEERWVCSQSAASNCQTQTGTSASTTACWQPVTTPPSSECVYAATYADALAACGCLCEDADAVLSDACDSSSCTVTTPLDCTLTDTVLDDGTHICTSGYNADEVSCPSTVKLFDASISVVMADGTHSAISGLVGYLDFSVSNCGSTTCDLEISMLSIPHRDIAGVYVQGTTVAGAYTLDSLSMQMNGTLQGTYNPSRRTVTFPSATFTASGTMAGATLNSVALPLLAPGDRFTLSTTQVMGQRQTTTSPLTLNFAFNVPGGTASASLTTR